MSLRSLSAIAAIVAGIGAAQAQNPPPPAQPAAVTGNPNLRPLPDGPGKRVAELQGLDKVTARTQRFYAAVGQPTRFGTLEITVGDCLVNVPEAPPESVAYLTIIDHKPGQPQEKLFAGVDADKMTELSLRAARSAKRQSRRERAPRARLLRCARNDSGGSR